MQTVTHIKRLCWKSTHFLCNDDFNKFYVKSKDFPEGKVTQTFNTKLYDALEFEGGKKQKRQLHKTFNVCPPIPPFSWMYVDVTGPLRLYMSNFLNEGKHVAVYLHVVVS